jgi:membrane protease YdiL (CAAX protease family)
MPGKIGRLKTVVVLWTILPWLGLTLGLHYYRSIFWSFFLYHGCCLLPVIIWRRKSWRAHLIPPTVPQIAAIALVGAALGVATIFLHAHIGNFVLERQHALTAMSMRGFQISWLVPLSIYFFTVNPVVEELFWRGVVLNDLCEGESRMLSLPYIWTNVSFAAWHWLVVRLFVSPMFIPLAIAIVAAVGFFLSWLYRRTGSVILPMLWHGLVFDMAVIVLLWLVV